MNKRPKCKTKMSRKEHKRKSGLWVNLRVLGYDKKKRA